MAAASEDTPQLISTTTVYSLLSTLLILAAAHLSSRRLLPSTASAKTRFLFIWHATDALIHFILEGGYLYNCFFSYTPVSSGGEVGVAASEYLPPNVFFLGDRENVYGAAYGLSPMSALWKEYARADRRWAGTDLGVISLELLTVFVAGPLAVWVCWCLVKKRGDAVFWMVVLATGELYGGWMTFMRYGLLFSRRSMGSFLGMYADGSFVVRVYPVVEWQWPFVSDYRGSSCVQNAFEGFVHSKRRCKLSMWLTCSS